MRGDTSKPRELILVIDDDAELREIYGALLGSQNYRFAVARNTHCWAPSSAEPLVTAAL